MHHHIARQISFVCILIVGASLVSAVSAAPPEKAVASIRAEDIVTHVKILAADDYQGRMPGTIGEEKTLAYLTGQLRKYGVTPMPGGSYLQDVPLVKKTPQPSTRLVVKSKNGDTALVIGENATAKTGGAVAHVSIDASDIVFVGFGIVAETQKWDDYAGIDVKGKTVMALIQDPRGAADSLYFKGRALSHYGTGLQKSENAARHGARGIILVHDQDAVGYPFPVIATSAKRSSFERVRDAKSAPIPDFGVTISKDVASQLLASAGYDYATLVEEASQKGFRAKALPLSLSGEIATKLEYSTSHNVIGYIPGRERPDEYVLYTAHWDHVGIGAAVNGDSIYNGAIDNATGTAALLELAQTFAALERKPSRSIVFIATAAEEQGLLGAYHYADHPVFPLNQTAGVINMDALFPFGDFNGLTVVGLGSSELEIYLKDAATQVGRTLLPDPTPEYGAFFRSDHYPFVKKGVPAIFAVGGPADDPPPAAEMSKRFDDYMKAGYHHPSDEYRDDWDMRGIVGDVKIYFLTGYALANESRFPNWYPDSEFRPIRDRQRAAP